MRGLPFMFLGACRVPDNVTNGWVKSDSRYVGSVVNYYCNHGYMIEGLMNRTCQDSGIWNGQKPLCRKSKKLKRNNNNYYSKYPAT